MGKLSKIFKSNKCCGEKFECGFVYDNPTTGYAYNVRGCTCCGNIFVENVWENPGIILIKVGGEIISEGSKVSIIHQSE